MKTLPDGVLNREMIDGAEQPEDPPEPPVTDEQVAAQDSLFGCLL